MTEIMSLRIREEDKKDFLFLAKELNITQSSLFTVMIKKYCKMKILEISKQIVDLENNDPNIGIVLTEEMRDKEMLKYAETQQIFFKVHGSPLF